MSAVVVPVVVVMLSDAQLAEEIEAAQAEVCCPSYAAAAAAWCGCGGVAAEYLARLHGEAESRVGGAV